MHIPARAATATAILTLLCSCLSEAAQAQANTLEGIDSQLVSANFPLKGLAIGEESDGPEMPGCAEVKSFETLEANAPGQIVVALCKEGDHGPDKIEKSISSQIAQAREALKRMPAAARDAMLPGLDPVAVPLAGGRRGKALTIPAVGHGMVMVPTAYTLTAGKDKVLLVQAYLDPNAPRNLNAPMAALLKAIDARLQQAKP